MRRYICPTPQNECFGGRMETNFAPINWPKSHNSPQEAYKCYVKYLISVGFEPSDSQHCFKAPAGNPLGVPEGSNLMLSKPSHFGAVMRGGKRGDGKGSVNQANRLNPYNGRAGIFI